MADPCKIPFPGGMGDRLPMSNFDQKLGETNGGHVLGPFGDFHPVILGYVS